MCPHRFPGWTSLFYCRYDIHPAPVTGQWLDAPKSRIAKISPTRNDDILELRNIHKSYDGLAVLRGVSLSAKPGTVTSIIGSLGSGKSTWLCCANLLETCQAGDIVFAGEPLRWHGESEKRRPALLRFIFRRKNL